MDLGCFTSSAYTDKLVVFSVYCPFFTPELCGCALIEVLSIEIPNEGNSMPRGYSNIEQYESEIIKLKEEGYTHREIGEKLGLTKKQIKGFFSRYHCFCFVLHK